ncbi:MAG: beta-propeller fold lactonase family protein [Acidobacteriaceae bacterium]|jgi:6-phosphogluconolactonase (cycloisomerase 2 family)|nr:beta-propeller fold lactonase family protein [Acidobacteriaceae bacterium]
MKFSQTGRIIRAAALSLAVGLGMTACSSDYTLDYLYVITSKASAGSPNGGISAYKVDNQSGTLLQMPDSPYDSGGINPVAIALAPNGKALYVINNGGNRAIVEFLIGTDGKIYPQNSYDLGPTSTSGSLATGAVIDATNQYLLVSFTYQHGFSSTTPGPGGVAVFAINADNSLNSTPIANGALPYFATGNNPVSIGISPCTLNPPDPGACKNSSYVPYVYVVEQDPAAPRVRSFQLSLTTGKLTQVGLVQAGVTPRAIAEDPTSRFVYVTDSTSNQLIGYIVQSNGSLNPMVNGPFSTGLYPEGITIDPRGQYIYVTNYNASTVSGYAINAANGTPTGVFSNGVSTTGTGPNCVTVEPSQGVYLYTSNFIDNTVSGMQLDPHTGALSNIQNTPFNAGGNPTCAVAVQAGSHSFQALQP